MTSAKTVIGYALTARAGSFTSGIPTRESTRCFQHTRNAVTRYTRKGNAMDHYSGSFVKCRCPAFSRRVKLPILRRNARHNTIVDLTAQKRSWSWMSGDRVGGRNMMGLGGGIEMREKGYGL